VLLKQEALKHLGELRGRFGLFLALAKGKCLVLAPLFIATMKQIQQEALVLSFVPAAMEGEFK